MQKNLLLCAVAAAVAMASGAATAAPDFTVYGKIDTGIWAHKTTGHKDQNATKSTIVEMAGGITGGSRWGIKGTEELGNGYSVGFRLEEGFNSDDGSYASNSTGRAFGRDCFLDFTGPFGNVRIGRTGALASGNGPTGIMGRVSPFSITWKDAALTKVFSGNISARIDNSITYQTPNFSGLTGFVQYSNGIDGDDAVRDSQKDRYLAVGAAYHAGALRLVAVFDNMFYNDKLDPDRSPTYQRTLKDQRTYNFGGSYNFGGTRVYAGYQYGENVVKPKTLTDKLVKNAKASTTRNNMGQQEGYTTNAYTLGTSIKLAGGELKGVVGHSTGKRSWQDQEFKVYQAALGYLYPMSKSTSVYGGIQFLRVDTENSTDERHERERGAFIGMVHNF